MKTWTSRDNPSWDARLGITGLGPGNHLRIASMLAEVDGVRYFISMCEVGTWVFRQLAPDGRQLGTWHRSRDQMELFGPTAVRCLTQIRLHAPPCAMGPESEPMYFTFERTGPGSVWDQVHPAHVEPILAPTTGFRH